MDNSLESSTETVCQLHVPEQITSLFTLQSLQVKANEDNHSSTYYAESTCFHDLGIFPFFFFFKGFCTVF